jgi:hypothetical protein
VTASKWASAVTDERIVLPLDQAVEAIVLAESKPAGKVVIRVSE